MQSSTLSLYLCLFLSIWLLLSSFYDGLYVYGQQAGFSFDSGKVYQTSLKLIHGTVDSSGVLTLNSSSGDAEALYSTGLPLYDTTSKSVLSFTTFFTFSSNSTSKNGTLAFVIVPDLLTTGLVAARQTFSVELNTSCDPWGSFSGSDPYGPGGGQWWGGLPGGGDGFNGGGFQVAEYINGSSVAAYEDGYGPDWDPTSYQNAPYFCVQQPNATIYQYLVAIEYNASTGEVLIGSPSCGSGLARTATFDVKNLSTIPAFTKNLYVGFTVTGGAVYSVLQWNFTNNSTTNSVMSLAMSSSVTTPGGGGGGGGGSAAGGAGGMYSRRSGRSKKLVITLSVLGAAVGMAAVFCVCCLCVRKRRRMRAAAHPTFVVAKRSTAGGGTKPYKSNAPTSNAGGAVQEGRETAPLNTYANSAFTGTASWLQPVAPR